MPTRKDVEEAAARYVHTLLDYMEGRVQLPQPTPAAPPAAPVLRFTRAPPRDVQEATLHVENTTGKEAEWIVFANDERNTWRGKLQPVPASGEITVKATRSGDRVKVRTVDGKSAVDSEPFVFTYATPAGTSNAALLLHKMGLGVNQERFTVHHAGARTTQYYQRYRDAGIRHVRFFAPYGPKWGIDGSQGSVLPWLEAARACVNSGMPVTLFDACDVMATYKNDNIGQFGDAADDYLRMVCRMVHQMQFPVDSFAIGAVNEYADVENAACAPHRFRMNEIIRSILPNHTIIEGPSCWKDPRSVYDPDMVPWGGQPRVGTYTPWNDDNTLTDVHHYFGFDAGTLAGIAQRCIDWGRTPVFSGEWGFDTHHPQDPGLDHNISTWVRRFHEQTDQQSICAIRPTMWAVTDGGAWRLNERGGNTWRAEAAPAIPHWATKIDQALGLRS